MSKFSSQQRASVQVGILHELLTVPIETLMPEVLRRMSQARTSCALVIENQRLVGILTERDVVRAVATQTPLETLTVSDLMSRQVITLEEPEATDLSKVLQYFHRYRIRHLPIINAEGQIVGMATPESVRQTLQPTDLLRMRRVQEVMETRVLCADRSASIKQLAQLMASRQISCVVIVEEAPNPVVALGSAVSVAPQFPIGIVTERDIVQYRSLNLDLATAAGEIMSTPLLPIRPCDTLWQANQEMQHRRIRRLVVMGASGELAGIITQTNILKALDPIELSEVIQSLRQLVDQKDLELQRESTERQQVEQLLRQMHQTFEQKVSDRTEALQQENAALRQQNAELEKKLCDRAEGVERSHLRWLHRVTYEAQTVISNINMAAQMLEIMLRQLGVLRKSSSAIAPYFQVIREECQQGIRILNEVPQSSDSRDLPTDDSHFTR